MCGIVGLYVKDAGCDEQQLTRMRDLLVHRGPDDAGNFVDGPVGLAQRRLSIIDLSSGGHQPMKTEDERFVLVYNGELYNYKELRRDLEAKGVRFRSNSDTEVILRLHVHEGDTAVAKLNGIFAYALWDKHAQRMLLARDRAGIKPLYIASGPRGVAFASEIKALFASGVVEPRINAGAVAEYLLFRQVAGPHNLFADVDVLMPGHTMEIVNGRASAPKAYWTANGSIPAPFAGSYDDAVNELDAVLNRCVQRQLMADVPLGTFCSRGIDSSLTSAIAARHASQRINTFSVGFHEADFDESVYARMAAAACNSNHHELRIDESEYVSMLPRLVWHSDLPLNFANSVHIFALSKLAREHVTVVLTGEGADELFGGYPRYYIPRLLAPFQSVPGAVRKSLLGLMTKAPDHRLRKLGKFAGQSADDTLLYNCTGLDRDTILRATRRGATLDTDFRMSCIREARARGLDEVSVLAQLDFRTYLVSILNRQDKMSMATSLEARVPFLDNEIIDFARSLPLAYKQTLRKRKRVLQSVALRYLPADIVHRRKSGFGVPLKPWFASQGPMSKLLDATLADNGIAEVVDVAGVKTLQAEHRAGAADHSELLWGVLNLGIWRQTFIR